MVERRIEQKMGRIMRKEEKEGLGRRGKGNKRMNEEI